MIKRCFFSKPYIKFLTAIIFILINGMILVGCGNDNSFKNAFGSGASSRNELFSYLGMDIEEANSQLREKGFSASLHDYDTLSDYRSITIGNYLVLMDSQRGKYIDRITIYEDAGAFSVMGIHVGLSANEALEILRNNEYTFTTIYDSSDEEHGDYQGVFYIKNGVYQICLVIYGGGETNPYGSLDESDIHMDGTVGEIDISCVVTDSYYECANEVGDRSGSGWYLIESINDNCIEMTQFTENDSFNVPGVNEYGTYVFGKDVITVELRAGNGNCPYVTRIAIGDICPYKLYGIYYGMDKESALTHISELGIAVGNGEENRVLCNVDSYTTLEIHFTDDYVCFIECIDEYPENHEKQYIE